MFGRGRAILAQLSPVSLSASPVSVNVPRGYVSIRRGHLRRVRRPAPNHESRNASTGDRPERKVKASPIRRRLLALRERGARIRRRLGERNKQLADAIPRDTDVQRCVHHQARRVRVGL
jgi:hypothetical protein